MQHCQEILQCLLTSGKPFLNYENFGASTTLDESISPLSRDTSIIVTLNEDLKNNDTATLDYDTISFYLEALKKIFVVEDMSAWNLNLRSKLQFVQHTRYFVAPSIATAALGLGSVELMNDLKTMGFFFEAMCVRDLRIFAESLNGKVYHYRDKSGLECDAVVHLRSG